MKHFIIMLMLSITFSAFGQNVISITNIVPTLGVAADSIGYVIGGIQTLTGVMKFPEFGGHLVSVSGSDKKNNKPALDIYFFSQSPSHGTYTNHTPYVSDSTDMSHYLCRVHVAATDWTTQSTYATLTGTVYNYTVKSGSTNTNLYVIMVATALYVPTTTKDLTFSFGVSQN